MCACPWLVVAWILVCAGCRVSGFSCNTPYRLVPWNRVAEGVASLALARPGTVGSVWFAMEATGLSSNPRFLGDMQPSRPSQGGQHGGTVLGGGGSSSSLPGCRCRWRKEGLETSQGSLISPTLPGLLGTAELPGPSSLLGDSGCLGQLLLPSAAREPGHPRQRQRPKPQFQARHQRSGRASGQREDACPRAALGTPLAYPWPGIHLGVEWYVPVCTLGWLLVYLALVPCSEHGERRNQLT